MDFDTGLIGRKPIKRCHKCYDTNHDEKLCPHKRVQDRTPEVQAMIKRRFERVKAQEYNDPLLSKGYKEKHYLWKEQMEQRKELKKSKKEGKRLRDQEKVPNMSASATSTCYHEEEEEVNDYLAWKQIKGPTCGVALKF